MHPLTAALMAWYSKNRRDLPWRRTRDPYHIWVSEVMLQQTRVETVIQRYPTFIKTYPTLTALSQAQESQVLQIWQGLGYYSRARHLLQAAKKLQGRPFPHLYREFLSLPGVGEYTASAVFCIAFQEQYLAVDSNILRIAARLFKLEGSKNSTSFKKIVQERLFDYLPAEKPGDFNQALMDFGSLICTPRNPHCTRCPVTSFCLAKRAGLEKRLPLQGPPSRPQKIPVHIYWITAESQEILLRRRNQGTFLQGLWELPFQEGEDTWIETLAERGHHPRLEKKRTFSHRYLFTHKDWQMTVIQYGVQEAFPLTIEGQEEYRWFLPKKIGEIGMATVFRRVLKQKNEA